MSWSFKQKLDTSDPIFTATARLLVEVLAGEITANNLKTKKNSLSKTALMTILMAGPFLCLQNTVLKELVIYFLKNKIYRQIQTD